MVPPNNVDLHRLIWSPDDFDGDQLLYSAFSKNDLAQDDRYLSVDRTDQIDEEVVRAIAAQQAERADGEDIIREEPHSALLQCGHVRELVDEEEVRPFEVRPEILPDNPAHCGIHNVTGKRNRGYINELRTLLVSVVHRTLSLNEFFAEENNRS